MNIADKHSALWEVNFTRKAKKQAEGLPKSVFEILALLKGELELEGPVQPEWHHYGKLVSKKGEYHHCHLNKGKPRYVAVWEVISNTVRVIEIRYAGTHENVSYRQFK